MRKIFAYILTFSLIFSLFPAYVNASNLELVLLEKEKDIVVDGKVAGTLHRTITREIDGSIVYLKTTEIEKFNDGRVNEKEDITSIELIDENYAKINGEVVDLTAVLFTEEQEELSLSQQNQQNRSSYTVLKSGGRYSYTEYEDRLVPEYNPTPFITLMKSASGIKNRLFTAEATFLDIGGAKDDMVTKTAITNGPHQLSIINFKHYAGDVAAARSTILVQSGLLITALGITALTAATVIGALAGAAGVASIAVAIWDAGNDANSSMESAYEILKTI